MTGSTEQRDSTRDLCHIPLLFARQQSQTYHEATVFNISEEGMYLEAQRKLSAGDDIRIRLTDTDAHGLEKPCIEMNNATVVWCAEVEKYGRQLFGAGISFSAVDIIVPEEDFSDIEYHCDMCGKRMSAGEFKKIQDSICLCPICHEYLNSFPESLRKWCIERFLMGNSP